ncbi:dnaJ homolog subfamily C member 7-like [Haliotis cracherodii]|uniref:dnaJ homolog subfamily C member 7-like n=1 Tax=Haliotis cracherodii TaxID=6455 RepID=UPI0039E9FF98
MSDTEMCEADTMQTEEEEGVYLTEEEIVAEAEKKKAEGNTFYKQQKYTEALSHYTEAINLCPSCSAYYGNRAATYIMLNKYKEALEDSRKAIQIEPNFVKAHLREAKCHLAMGEAAAAVRSYQEVLQREEGNTVAKNELQSAQGVQEYEDRADKSFEKGDFRTAVFCMDRCIDTCPACCKFKIRKAEALALLGRYQESQELANDILQRGGMNADALYVRGMCLYYQDNIEKAFQHFQHVLRLAPDHQKAKDIYKKAKSLMAKKEEGNTAFRSGKYDEAYNLYSEALAIDSNNKFTNSKLYFNRATVCSKLHKLDQSIENCSKAVELDDTYLKAYLRRAKCYMETEQYQEAVCDYEKIFKMDKSKENKRLLQEAKLELKKSKRKDYYKILGISKNATEDEIKKAYRKRALIHHPDRHSHDTTEKQKEEEKKFKELGEAYGVLSDPKKKMRYDSGQDLEEMDGGGFGDIDPNQIFQTFFGGGAGPGFQQFHFGSGGHPGYTFQFG